MFAGGGSVSGTSGLLRRLSLSYRAGLAVVLLVALFTHLPFSSNLFSTDDYMIRTMVMGDAALYEHGFTKANPDKSFWQGLMDAFHFYSPDAGTLQQYKDYGNLPWWSGDAAQMSPWRPLSALTHWVDYQIAPSSAQFQTLHTLVYVLLFAFCGYRLFWRLSEQSSIAVLASMMLIVDFSHLMSFNWIAARNVFIAGALGCAALEQFVLWRSERKQPAFVWSLVLFALALFSAEASIAIGGYLFAYLLFVERSDIKTWIKALLPYVFLVLLWRIVYNHLGYGASGISLYLDPGRTPIEFLLSVIQTLPLRYASVILSLDGTVATLSPVMRIWAAMIATLLVLACLLMILPLVRRKPLVRFMLLGSVLAAIPASALVTVGPRAGLFISVGYFWIIALWLHKLMRKPSTWVAKILVAAVLGVHLFIPMTIDFFYTSRLLPVVYVDDQQFDSVAKPLSEGGQTKALVVVNSPTPNTFFYLPFEWQLQWGTLPAALNMLVPGFATFDLNRLTQQDFEITAKSGIPLGVKQKVMDLEGEEPNMSLVYTSQTLQGLFVSPDARFETGQTYEAGNMTVRIKSVEDGLVTGLEIHFDDTVSVDQMVWQRYDWNTREYQRMSVPAVGEKIRFVGPLDIDAANLLKLCLDCEEETGEVIDRVDHG